MTEAPPSTAPDPSAGPEPERVLRRSGSGRMLTGVCAGLGRYIGMDPVLFRVGFAVLVLASGIGIMLYVAAFLLMRQPDGGAGYLERWTRRMFDAETVLALMAAVFAFGLIINVASGGINRGTIVVGTLLAIVLLAAHARGVDLLTMAKSMPDRATGRRGMTRTAPAFTAPYSDPSTAAYEGSFSFTGPGAKFSSSFSTPPHAPYGPPAAGDAATAAATAADAPAGTGDAGATEDTGTTTAHGPAGAPAPPAEPQPDGYRRLSDLAREARAGTYGYSTGEPFAPHGPYTKREPYASGARPFGPAPSPYTPAPLVPRVRRPKRPKSFVGALTIWLALIVGGVMVTMQRSGGESLALPVIGGAMLVTIGTGLLVTAWFGRGAVLVAAGTIVALVLIGGSTVSGIPGKVGSFSWHPLTITDASRDYVLGMGEGKLDLSEVELAPGTRVRVNASVSVGQITVIVPPTARVEVHGYTRLGEVKIDHKVEDGTDVRFNRILEPEWASTETTGQVPSPAPSISAVPDARHTPKAPRAPRSPDARTAPTAPAVPTAPAAPTAPTAPTAPADRTGATRTGTPPTIELYVKAGVGDVEVRRGA